jgi:PAS domain S-box-containing protein
MTQVAQVLRFVELAVFVLVAAVATARWVERRGAPRAWLAATFGLLALVIGVGEVLPKDADGVAPVGWTKALIVVLLLFPYFLYRFMATFERPPRWMSATGHALVAAVMVGTLAVHRFPQPGEVRSPGFTAYVALILVEWTFLSGVVSVRLWRAGKAQPTVARRRMRVLGSGAALLAAALVVAGAAPAAEASAETIVVQVVGILSAVLFLCGFAPPRPVLRSWRARDIEAIQGALVGLAQATTPDEVVRDLLPRMVSLVGARGAALYRVDGTLIGRTGATRDDADMVALPIQPGVAQVGTDHLRIDLPGGRLDLWTTPYTPYFGRDELDLLRNVGALLHVTLERTFAHVREVAAREALDEAQRVAHVGSFRRDLSSDVVEASAEFYRLYDLEPGEITLTREYFASRMHPDDRAPMEHIVADAIAAKSEFTAEYRIVRADGSARWLHSRGRALTDASGEVVALLGTCQDVTEARRVEKMRREFVANAAHELRTPLTTVSGMAFLLAAQRDRLSPAELDAAFDALGRQGERARVLVSSLLDLSRIDAGRLPVQLAPTPVGPVIEHAVETAPPPEGTHVTVDCPDGATAVADPDRLHEVLVNLLTNAYRYGGPCVTVSCAAEGDRVRVSVTDDGPGVPEDFLPALFQPFSRATGVTGTPGSGLGLAISQRLAAALGGELSYEPPAKGARFVLRLRAAR